MIKRIAVLIVVLLVFSSAVSAQMGGGIFGPPAPNPGREITVCDNGCDATKICGLAPGSGGANSCGDIPSDPCVAGSALARAATLGCSPTSPCSIKVGPGHFNECVLIDNITDVEIRGSGIDSTLVYPTPLVAYNTDISGGVVRIANVTTTRASTARIVLSDMTIRGNAWSAPEACVQVGKESTSVNTVAPWDDIIVERVKLVCPHDGYQNFGSRLTTDDDLPTAIFRDSVVYAGDDITKKAWSKSFFTNNIVYSWTNASETTDTVNLAVRGPSAVNGGDLQRVDLQTSEDFPTGSFAGRKITLTNGVGTCAAAGERMIYTHDNAADSVRVVGDWPDLADPNCNYTISAVKHSDGTDYVAGDIVEALYTDVDWSRVRDGTIAGFWKNSCFHLGVGNTAAAPVGDETVVQGLLCHIEINDFGPSSGSGCGGQAHVVPVLVYASSWETGRMVDVTASVNVNTDLEDNITCASPISGVALTGNAIVDSKFYMYDLSVHIINRGDADENTTCVSSEATNAGELVIDGLSCEIDNSVGGYAGTKTHLIQSSTSTLTVLGEVNSDEVLLTSGTITGWNEECYSHENALATEDDYPIPVVDSFAGVKVAYFACRCIGTCAGTEQLVLEDEAGNAISGTVNCVDNSAAITWTDVRADTDGLIPVGQSPRTDVITAGAATDDLEACVRYTTSRWSR